ncbi:hypothetical protein E1176_10255 [Fulvivirga sp. RKSG066]|uniref:hypothetical protein n=1 Tax=Fulvivirga aurantia TaxID=2529383 RepID=UPI0012BD43FD|nr:hypothetical protein [Fulvivirga aurantia]MTI21401.1 hypothetical protein [Fulvivirga aurantia]
MKKFLPLSILVLVFLFSSNCASIVSKTTYPVNFASQPSEVDIKITDRKGNLVFSGHTPALVQLKSGAGFFTKAIYNVTYSKEGYKDISFPVEADIDGWYFGNIVFGGLIGLLIVDPASGAMYKISNPFYNMALQQDDTSAQLNVYSIEDIPESWKSDLVKIN